MPQVSKRHIGLIPFAASEPTYMSGVVMTGSLHTIGELVQLPYFDIEYADDGNRGMGQYTRGDLAFAAPSGRIAKGTYKIRWKGNTISGSLANGVPNHNVFWLGAGLSSSFEQGLSALVFKPNPVTVNPVSFAMQVYSDGEVLPISGAYCTLAYESTGAKEVDFTYAIQGLCPLPTDGAAPARSWPASGSVAPTAKNVQFTVGSFTTAVVRSHKFTWAPTISPRIDQNAVNGHSGFDIVGGKFTGVIVIENPAKATYDPDTDRDNATVKALTLQVGSVAGNTLVTSMPNAIVTGVKRTTSGNISELEITYTATVVAPDDTNYWSLTAK